MVLVLSICVLFTLGMTSVNGIQILNITLLFPLSAVVAAAAVFATDIVPLTNV